MSFQFTMPPIPRVLQQEDRTGAKLPDGLTSRRSIMAALAALPIGAILPFGTVEAAPALRRERVAWDAAVSAFDAAKAAYRKHWEGVMKPALDAYDAIPGPPPRSFTVHCNPTPFEMGFDPKAKHLTWELEPVREIREAGLKLRAQWAEYEEACHQTRLSLDLETLNQQNEMLCDAECDAERTLFATPAPDLKAVLCKMELMWADDREAPDSYRNHVLSDVRRLAESGNE